MKSFRRIFLIGFPVLLVIIAIVYVILGGFKEPEIKIAESPGYIILGKRFTGKLDERKLKETYKEAQEKYRDGELNGVFAVMHFHEPNVNTGKVDAVIGVVVKDSLSEKPEGFNYFTWRKGPVVQTKILSHYSVAPSPETINEVMNKLAESKGYKVENGSLERYLESNHLEVERPLKKVK